MALAAWLRDELASAGHPVDWVEFDGGHAVAPVAVARASAFLRRAIERRT
jgi:predicted esterase